MLPIAVAVNASHLYWTTADDGNLDPNSGTIVEANLDGSNPQTIATGQSFPEGVAVNASHLYWSTAFDSNGDSNSGTIVEANLDGSNPR